MESIPPYYPLLLALCHLHSCVRPTRRKTNSLKGKHSDQTSRRALQCIYRVFTTHLGVGEVGDSVEVGGDELAPWVLVDAELGVLDLVVVDHPVEANNHRCRRGTQQTQDTNEAE